MVLHSCDNRKCVNPAHLRAGTHRDNMDDRCARGRTPKGNKLPHTKLTPDDVRQIRALYAAGGWSQTALAERYGVSRRAIQAALNGESWKHVA